MLFFVEQPFNALQRVITPLSVVFNLQLAPSGGVKAFRSVIFGPVWMLIACTAVAPKTLKNDKGEDRVGCCDVFVPKLHWGNFWIQTHL